MMQFFTADLTLWYLILLYDDMDLMVGCLLYGTLSLPIASRRKGAERLCGLADGQRERKGRYSVGGLG